MTIVRHEHRMQVTCDSCPASYPNTYTPDDFDVMIADARAAGWRIAKAGPKKPGDDTADLFGSKPRVAGGDKAQPYTHACPDCAAAAKRGSLL